MKGEFEVWVFLECPARQHDHVVKVVPVAAAHQLLKTVEFIDGRAQFFHLLFFFGYFILLQITGFELPVGSFINKLIACGQADQPGIRNRLSKAFQYIVSQRLAPKKDGTGRVPLLEILRSTLRTRDYVEQGEQNGKTLLDAMKDGKQDGMQHFDGEIERLLREDVITLDTAMSYATNPNNLRLEIADLIEERRQAEKAALAAATG